MFLHGNKRNSISVATFLSKSQEFFDCGNLGICQILIFLFCILFVEHDLHFPGLREATTKF